jgi:hypothetical protein
MSYVHSELGARALRRKQLKEARKLPTWKTLSQTDRHVASHLARHMRPYSGEIFKNERALCTLIPPAPTKRGRPNTSGHIHRSTLRASLARLEAAGIFTSWKTNGKRVKAHLDPALSEYRSAWIRNGRTPAIRVWRLNRIAWSRAWAALKHARRHFVPSKDRGRLDGSSRELIASRPSRQRGLDPPVGPFKTLLDVWRADPKRYACDLADVARAA